VTFDFESGELTGWCIVEGTFGQIVCARSEYHHHGGAYNKHGTYFLSTLETPDNRPDDRYTGVVESPVFRLTAPQMSFLVGGGNHRTTYVALCTLDGAEKLRATGKRSQVMQRVSWNAQELVGRRVYLKIVDQHVGGWGHVTFDHFTAQGMLDPSATAARNRRHDVEGRRTALTKALNTVCPERIRAALSTFRAFYGNRYRPPGDADKALVYLEDNLARVKQELKSPETDVDQVAQDCMALLAAGETICRDILVAHPFLRENPILFVVRHQYKPDHHNTATMFQTGTVNTGKFQGGGAIRVLDLSQGFPGTVTTLFDPGKTGAVRDPDVHFSGSKFIFSMRRRIDEDYHIYELDADGARLRQLTAASGVTDIDPLYLPDDSIAFTSTREPKFCMCNCHIMGNLFRMDSDGANIRQIGKSTLHEGHGSLMPDGRILYDRWEYVDRNFGDAQGVWTVNPDGTNHAVYWGNNTNSPGGVLDARIIPGTHQTICVFGSCHDRPWGALAIVDRRLAVDGRPGVVQTWPESAIELVGKGNYDTFKKVRPRYEDPYPLPAEDTNSGVDNAKPLLFLCARTIQENSEETGVFLVDTFGNQVLLHREAPGCFSPMPLAARPRPPVIPSRRSPADDTGILYVSDVYRGTHMRDVQRGSITSLRVVESPEKRFWTASAWGGQGVHRPAMNWHSFENKRILGTVPVEPDGSCAFRVPAGTFIYFQLLDAEGMMVQSMRSGTIVQPGETTGCIGCHEPRQSAPHAPTATAPVAVTKPPCELNGWYGPPRLFSFRREVQPTFDKHCAGCHDFGTQAGKKLCLAGDRSMTFNVAYNELWRKKAIIAVGAGPAEIQQARSWGSHVSPLIQTLRRGHKDVQLSQEELDRLITWVDINAPYYPTYASAYPANLAGRCPLNNSQLNRLTELVGVPFAALSTHRTNRGPQVSFDRPELSPCLRGLETINRLAYDEAVAIIRAGQASLDTTPRADGMEPGFVPCPLDRKRQTFYEEHELKEHRRRTAIREGRKIYDTAR
jgi:hypothetical protein